MTVDVSNAMSTALVPCAAKGSSAKQQIVVAQRKVLADKALNACGLLRNDDGQTEVQAEDKPLDDEKMAQMHELIRTRGVKKRLADDFELEMGKGATDCLNI
eukprot:TRINITY_DN3154_c0_g3_i4.p2 TRINITY_DN3154_c0_g3~~TRINITY_DN3154_c0_g3_i4.p2  ORF type:complete len:119 (+),score=17.92 TRINITY_DN3154_c0_g3_i4:54-359(+)